ncbi:hypothetical protein [Haloferula sp.]|uniref:hypothetical protein n=1 Tax=Haloferula sp. TaxID=2497595 RepID=UPI003C730300
MEGLGGVADVGGVQGALAAEEAGGGGGEAALRKWIWKGPAASVRRKSKEADSRLRLKASSRQRVSTLPMAWASGRLEKPRS